VKPEGQFLGGLFDWLNPGMQEDEDNGGMYTSNGVLGSKWNTHSFWQEDMDLFQRYIIFCACLYVFVIVC
jgi:hypothetical protein